MNEILCKQLAADYCCTVDDVKDDKNHFTIYEKRDDRRKFEEDEECFLKIIAINDKLLFTGKKEIIDWCEEEFGENDGAWFMEAGNMAFLNRKLNEFGYRISQLHPFYIAEQKTEVDTKDYEIKYFRGEEIKQFEEDDRFDEAFLFDDTTPDEVGVAAYSNGELLGMAGASIDSPYLWQIGINVMPEARGKNIGPMLVALTRNVILEEGKLPYYGTAISHIASQKVALKAGFMPAWTELVTCKKK